LPLAELLQIVEGWNLTTRERKIAGELLREITGRVQFLLDVGLDYLTLARGAATLSNGEAQRIRLASQLGSGLCGVLTFWTNRPSAFTRGTTPGCWPHCTSFATWAIRCWSSSTTAR